MAAPFPPPQDTARFAIFSYLTPFLPFFPHCGAWSQAKVFVIEDPYIKVWLYVPGGTTSFPAMKWRMKVMGMFVVYLRGRNSRFWSHLGCPGHERTILPIAHVPYIKIVTRLRGFRDKIAHFLRLLSRNSHKRLEHKRNQTNIEKWPESLGVMLEF